MQRATDHTGRVFSELTAISRALNDRHNKAQWLCACSCGRTTVVGSNALVKGNTRSCGHLRGIVHGMRKTLTYKSWNSMIQRCTNPNAKGFHNYGGRGITVCSEWREFPAFLQDMGIRPEGHTLDRINNEGNYEASNCRWATSFEQARNRRNTL